MNDSEIERLNALSHEIIGAALEVHKYLGPGLLEAVYEECLLYELQQRGLKVAHQVQRPIMYKGVSISHPLVIDILVEDQVILELKAVSQLSETNVAQLLSYLKLSELRLGLLINFNTAHLKDGIRRVVNGWRMP